MRSGSAQTAANRIEVGLTEIRVVAVSMAWCRRRRFGLDHDALVGLAFVRARPIAWVRPVRPIRFRMAVGLLRPRDRRPSRPSGTATFGARDTSAELVGREVRPVGTLRTGPLEQPEDAGPAQAGGPEVEQELEMAVDDGIEDGRLTSDSEVGGKAGKRGVERF